MQNLKQDIELINNFSSDFYSKVNAIGTKLNTTIQKTDTVIQEEKQNDVYLTNLENKMSEVEFKNILQTLNTYDKVLTEKKSEYNLLLDNNGLKINNISTLIRNNKEIIDNIYSLINILEEKVSSIAPRLEKKV
jgi:hypothetical protein